MRGSWGDRKHILSRLEICPSPLICMHAKLPQSCPALCNPMDCRLPGSSVHGILQVRILERGSLPSSRGSSPPRDWTHVFSGSWQADSLPLSYQGSPMPQFTLRNFQKCLDMQNKVSPVTEISWMLILEFPFSPVSSLIMPLQCLTFSRKFHQICTIIWLVIFPQMKKTNKQKTG